MVYEEHYHGDNAAVKAVTTLLGITLFFLIGWFANDAFQSAYQQNPSMQFGVGGGPASPTPVREMMREPTTVPTEVPTATPAPTTMTEPTSTITLTPVP